MKNIVKEKGGGMVSGIREADFRPTNKVNLQKNIYKLLYIIN